jgi:hypothetical protein
MSHGRAVNSVFPSDKYVTRHSLTFGKFCHGLFRLLKKAVYPMPSNAILHEATQLYNVSDRLDLLAEEHPLVSEALATISGSVRNTATLLEVLVAMKMGLADGLDPANA